MDAVAYKKSYQTAITLLSIREYSRHALQQRLIRRGYSKAVVEATLETLATQNLQSEVRFVESYVRSRKRRGYGVDRIRLELEQHGIPLAVMSPFLTEAQEDWQQHILAVWTKKFYGKKPTSLAEKAKQLRFLQYRGFTIEKIQWVWQREN